MAKKKTKVIKVLGSDITAEEEYYLNNPNLPTANSGYEYTPEMVRAIQKCKEDIIYFAEHFFYINGINGKEIIKLFDKQKEILRTIQNNKKTLLVTGRQQGKSTLMTIVAVWTALFFNDQTIMVIANKQSTAIEIFERIRLAFLQMDNWLKGGVKEFNKTFFTLANGSRILTSATSADAIRGYAIDVLLLDEFAIIPPKDADEFWAAVTPTLSSRFNNNKNAKLIVASTPKGKVGKFYELVSKAEESRNDFAIQKAYWYDFPGRTKQFKLDEIATLGEDLFRQEYECEFLSNSNSPFSSEMFAKFEEEQCDPINILDNGCYNIWSQPQPDHIYAMGVDTSEGVGQDYSIAQILDITNPLDIHQVAVYRTNTMDTTSWAIKLKEVSEHWFQPILLIERNGPGCVPCDKFYYDWNYPRMINHDALGYLRHGKAQTFYKPGVMTNNNTKGPCITNMKYYISDIKLVHLYDKETINELKTFTSTMSASGHRRWHAQQGFHDDHVMALAWAVYSLSTYVVDTWLDVLEKGTDGIPRRIKPKWSFNTNIDYSNSLYKAMDNRSPFIGVFVLSKPGSEFSNTQIAYNLNKAATDPNYRPGTLEYLLDNAQNTRYEGFIPQLPQSFNQYLQN